MTDTTELIDHWRAEEEQLVRAAMLMNAQANIDDALVRADLARRTADALSTAYRQGLEDAAKVADANAEAERELEDAARKAEHAEDCLLHALLGRENRLLAAAIRAKVSP